MKNSNEHFANICHYYSSVHRVSCKINTFLLKFLRIKIDKSEALKRASLVAQTVRNLPAVQEAHVQSLGQEDPLEKGRTTHSHFLAWRIPWTDHGVTESYTTEQLTLLLLLSRLIRKGA